MTALNKSCKVEKPWRFLFWKGVNVYYDHDWVYESREIRECCNCGIRQLYFGISLGSASEDWRSYK